MAQPELAILVPVLRRPHRVQPLLESIEAATPRARVVFVADPTDVREHRVIRGARREGRMDIDLICPGGNYARKINLAVQQTDEELVFLGADDLHFHPGWLDKAKAELRPPVGVVGTNDLCNKRTATGDLATHSLVTREYAARGTIDDPTKLLHEGYPHEYVDQEFTETAKARGAFAHAPESIVEHLHPQAGKAPMDELYAGQKPRMKQGYRVYRARRHLWMSRSA